MDPPVEEANVQKLLRWFDSHHEDQGLGNYEFKHDLGAFGSEFGLEYSMLGKGGEFSHVEPICLGPLIVAVPHDERVSQMEEKEMENKHSFRVGCEEA